MRLACRLEACSSRTSHYARSNCFDRQKYSTPRFVLYSTRKESLSTDLLGPLIYMTLYDSRRTGSTMFNKSGHQGGRVYRYYYRSLLPPVIFIRAVLLCRGFSAQTCSACTKGSRMPHPVHSHRFLLTSPRYNPLAGKRESSLPVRAKEALPPGPKVPKRWAHVRVDHRQRCRPGVGNIHACQGRQTHPRSHICTEMAYSIKPSGAPGDPVSRRGNLVALVSRQ